MERYRPDDGSTPFFPSGLHERSDDRERGETLDLLDRRLALHQYEWAMNMAQECEFGIRARMEAVMYWHRIAILNAHRIGDTNTIVSEQQYLRSACKALGKEYVNPLEEHHTSKQDINTAS